VVAYRSLISHVARRDHYDGGIGILMSVHVHRMSNSPAEATK